MTVEVLDEMLLNLKNDIEWKDDIRFAIAKTIKQISESDENERLLLWQILHSY